MATQFFVLAGLIAFAAFLLGGLSVFFLLARPARAAIKEIRDKFDERRQRFTAVFDVHPDAIAVYNVDGTMRRGNPSAIALFGYGDDLVGRSWREHVHPNEHDRVEKHFQYACEANVAQFETIFLSALGDEIPVICYLVPTIIDGRVVSVVGTARDQREIQRAQRKERLHTERIAALAAIKSEYAAHPHEEIQHLLKFVGNTLSMEGGAVSYITGKVLEVAFSTHPDVRTGLKLNLDMTFARHAYGSREVLAIADTTVDQWRDDPAVLAQTWKSYIGTTIFVEWQPFGILSFTRHNPRIEPFDAADVDFMRVAAALVGAGLERLRNEEALAKEAHFDRITGLANRGAFDQHLRTSVARAKRHGGHVRVHYIDLDGFKAVNDSLGHAAGDEVLRIIATRFRALVREDDLVARVGGDEFVVLESTLLDESESTALGNRIVAAASELMYVAGRIVRIGASVGVADYPRHAMDEAALLERADAAMYAAKTAGKGAVKLYSYG